MLQDQPVFISGQSRFRHSWLALVGAGLEKAAQGQVCLGQRRIGRIDRGRGQIGDKRRNDVIDGDHAIGAEQTIDCGGINFDNFELCGMDIDCRNTDRTKKQ